MGVDVEVQVAESPPVASTSAARDPSVAGSIALDASRPVEPYMPQLDSLRGLAIIGICLHHWLDHSFLHRWPTDSLRVQLFFTLSGFLITMILLKSRARAELAGESLWWTTWAFYVRRCLRIWPLFFLVLFVTAALNLRPVRETFWWHATFASNFLIYSSGKFPGITSHLWSLAVEEQFYLVWPLVILFVPQRLLPAVLIGIAVLMGITQAAVISTWGKPLSEYVTSASAAALVYGSLLATFRNAPWLDRLVGRLALFVGVPMCLATWWLNRTDALGPAGMPLQRAAGALILGYIVLRAARGFTGIIGAVLNFKPLVGLGTISFGVYILHNFPLTFLREYFNPYPVRVALAHESTRVALLGAITVTLSVVSYYGFEQPINRIKKHFPYVRRRPKPSASGEAPSMAEQTGAHAEQRVATDR